MKDNLKFTLLAIGIIVIFFIMGREIIETRVRLKKTQDLIVQQKKEKIWLQEELKTTRGELAKTSRDLRTCHGKLGFVNKKISVLRVSNAALIMAREGLERKIGTLWEEKRTMEAKLRSLWEEKRTMEAKLRSLSELKKAIREAKLEIRKEKTRQQKEADKWETASGNRGFLIKDGEYSYKAKVNVDVRPANASLNKK